MCDGGGGGGGRKSNVMDVETKTVVVAVVVVVGGVRMGWLMLRSAVPLADIELLASSKGCMTCKPG